MQLFMKLTAPMEVGMCPCMMAHEPHRAQVSEMLISDSKSLKVRLYQKTVLTYNINFKLIFLLRNNNCGNADFEAM